ncbi:ABC transporter permease [Streptomyces sp. NPDC005551]|uniref:ABC transporter permease n=1 Tax=Streptomyces sp. NPDC005551 TaxID=3364725 RepID=UPI0036C7D70F
MSATVTETAPAGTAPTTRDDRRPRAAAVLALARFEAREMFLQIPVFAMLVLYLAYTCWQLWSGREPMDDFPALQDADRATQDRPVLLAVAVLVCANRAVLRSRRRGTDQSFAVLLMEPWRRTAAHALSVVPVAVVTALVVALDFTCTALKPGAVGHGSPAELAVGPLTVLLAGVLGVLLARLVPSVFAAPLFVVGGLVLATLLSAALSDARWLRWLWPVVTDSGTEPLPSDLLGRPAAWHALYLAGLAAALACAAVLAAGGRTRLVAAVTVAALAATGAGVAGQSSGEPAGLIAAREKASVSPEKVQSCRTHGRDAYCAYPEWTGRTAEWAEVVKRVRSLTGGGAAGTRLTVRQRLDARYGLDADTTLEPSRTPGRVTVGTRWGGTRVPEFAVAVASVLVAGDENAMSEACDARVVTVMWLALGAESDPMAAFRRVRLDDRTSGSGIALTPTNPLGMTAQQADVIRELLEKPRYGVTAKVKAHWAELVSPKTTTARAAELLDVPVPEGTDACRA